MPYVIRLFFVSTLLLLTTGAIATASNQDGSANISFTVSMSQPHTHLLEVEMRIRQLAGAEATELVMPVWTPGSYLIREFERHVQAFAAVDANGRSLSWEKLNKNTWRVASGGAREW